jgi:hypothetical protein
MKEMCKTATETTGCTDPANLLARSERFRQKCATQLLVSLPTYDAALKRAAAERVILGPHTVGPKFAKILRDIDEDEDPLTALANAVQPASATRK